MRPDPDFHRDMDRLNAALQELLARPRRVVARLIAVAVVVLALTVLTGAWWCASRPVSTAPPALVSVLIADFQNRTEDPIFDHTLEPMLRVVLEGAGFISAYDRTRIAPSFGVRPPEALDEKAAQEIAVKQGLGVVLSGSLARQGGRFVICDQSDRDGDREGDREC